MRIIIILATLLSAGEAHAYIDPGTGSLIIQGLIAAVATVATTAGLYWRQVKGFFRRLTGRQEPVAGGRADDESGRNADRAD